MEFNTRISATTVNSYTGIMWNAMNTSSFTNLLPTPSFQPSTLLVNLNDPIQEERPSDTHNAMATTMFNLFFFITSIFKLVICLCTK